MKYGRGIPSYRINRNMEKNLKFLAKASLAVALAALTATSAYAAELATKSEAEAMVKKAVAEIKSAGKEKAYATFNDRTGPFTDRDLYIVVYDLSGKVLAHGANVKLIGQELIDAQDTDGKFYVKERVALAKKGQPFWHDYKFSNPTTKKVEPKQTYCEVLDGTAVCGGIYK